MTPQDVADLLAAWAPVRCRAMFGGLGVYRDGVIFAIVADGELYLKADASVVERLQPMGSEPFVFESARGTARMSYWRLPAEAYDNETLRADLCDHAFAAALRAAEGKAAAKRGARRKANKGEPAQSVAAAQSPPMRRASAPRTQKGKETPDGERR